MFELNYELSGIDTKAFYGVQNQNFNLIKSGFPTLKLQVAIIIFSRWVTRIRLIF